MNLDEKHASNPHARQVLEILDQGYYRAPSGKRVAIADEQVEAERNTKLYTPDDLGTLRARAPAKAPFDMQVEVSDATTQEAGQALAFRGDVVVLNFASARNPGGGFLGGAKAQEEELCRCSGLYRTLLTQPRYYQHHRERKTLLYSDHLIYSPRVPFFRVATKASFLETPFSVSVITAPAPNAGAIRRSQPKLGSQLRATFERRWTNALAVAEHRGHRTLVLGAWGCGAFRNDAAMVADTAKLTLRSPRFNGVFERVVFAIPGSGKVSRQNLQTFAKVFA